MKRFILLLAITFSASTWVGSQAILGIKGGIASVDVTPSDLVVFSENDVEDLRISIQDAKYGIHLGLFVQVRLGSFFLQPELLFNSNTVDYRIEDIQTGNVSILDENYQTLDIPFIIGLRAGPLRVGGGPVGHVFLNNTSDLFDLDGYETDFENITLGWQAGIGLDFWKLHLDLRYEGNLTQFGDHIVFHDQTYEFDDKPSRIIASIGVSF